MQIHVFKYAITVLAYKNKNWEKGEITMFFY